MIGQTFQPGADSGLKRQLNTENAAMSPMAQQALRILSLKLPTVLSGRPVSPGDLLKPRVGGAMPGMPVSAPMPSPSGESGYGSLMSIINAALGTATGPGVSVTPGVGTGGGTVDPTGGGGTGPIDPGPVVDPTAPTAPQGRQLPTKFSPEIRYGSMPF